MCVPPRPSPERSCEVNADVSECPNVRVSSWAARRLSGGIRLSWLCSCLCVKGNWCNIEHFEQTVCVLRRRRRRRRKRRGDNKNWGSELDKEHHHHHPRHHHHHYFSANNSAAVRYGGSSPKVIRWRWKCGYSLERTSRRHCRAVAEFGSIELLVLSW